jgi:hypothetical protein
MLGGVEMLYLLFVCDVVNGTMYGIEGRWLK